MLNDKDGEDLRALLAAAETVKPKLLSLLTLGPDALDNYAYAIKARVKGYDSAVTKITEKRQKGNAAYTPFSMTDVIGVRVLCLWPDDISTVLERLLRIIQEIAQTTLSSFAGQALADVLTEVIVYKAINSPAVYDVIGKQLTNWLLAHGRASDCVRVENSPRDRPYSSVHLVVWCRVQTAGRWLKVPVEFQIRTSLEDVWSEVDHRLRYKSRFRQTDGRLESVGNSILDQLKGQLDMAATSATSARELFTPVPPTPSASLARIAPERDALKRWGAVSASTAQQDAARALGDEVETFYIDFEKSPGATSASWGAKFDGLAETIRAAITARKADPSPHADDEERFVFTSNMELAQALLWRARLLRTDCGEDVESLHRIEELSEACLKTYLQLINSKLFEHSALLWFRFGNALLDLRGDFEQASIYLRRAYTESKTDAELVGTPLLVAIPRLFAYAIWRRQNDQYIRSLEQFGMQSAAAEHSLAPIKEAIGVMTPLLDVVEGIEGPAAFWDPPAERVRIANNLLSYVWYYGLMSNGAKARDLPSQDEVAEEISHVIGRNLLKKAYAELAKASDRADTLTPIHRIHTLATTAFILKDKKALASHLTELKAAIDNSDGNIPGTDSFQMSADLAVMEKKEIDHALS